MQSDGMIITYALRSLVAAAVIPPDRYTTITMPTAALFYSLPRRGVDQTSMFSGWREERVAPPAECVCPPCHARDVSSQQAALDTFNTLRSLGPGVAAPPGATLHLPCRDALAWTSPQAAAVRLLEGIRAGTGPLIVVVKCLRACGQPVCLAPGGGAAVGRSAVPAWLLACRDRSDGVEGREVSALITK